MKLSETTLNIYISDDYKNPEHIKKCETDDNDNKEMPDDTDVPKGNNNESLLASYKTAVTSFGVARIRNGRIPEKIFWTVATIFIVGFTCYTIYENSVRYLSYGVKTNIQVVDEE